VSRSAGWAVLALVFLDELLAVVAAWVWGRDVNPLAAVLAPVLVVALWASFASPRARFGGPVVRPAVKVLVFTLAGAGLWAAGHHGWAATFWAFSVVVNALAQLPGVQALVADEAASARRP
jgi:hypothetical protein